MRHLGSFVCQFNVAIQTKKARLDVPYHSFIAQVIKVLYMERRIREYQMKGTTISIWLKYYEDQCAIQHIEMGSRPSLPVYSRFEKIPLKGRGLALTLLSTSQGILSHRMAYAQNLGGKVICSIW